MGFTGQNLRRDVYVAGWVRGSELRARDNSAEATPAGFGEPQDWADSCVGSWDQGLQTVLHSRSQGAGCAQPKLEAAQTGWRATPGKKEGEAGQSRVGL